jgi:hypothetical protein
MGAGIYRKSVDKNTTWAMRDGCEWCFIKSWLHLLLSRYLTFHGYRRTSSPLYGIDSTVVYLLEDPDRWPIHIDSTDRPFIY